jgi:S1-C subfamily serine protease
MTPEDQRARAEVRPVKERVEDQLLNMPNVTGVDIRRKVTKGKETDRIAIVVSVAKKKPRSALSSEEVIPAEIDGIPTDVVEEQIVLHNDRVLLDEVAPLIDATTYSTLQGGISMGPCRSVFLSPPDVPSAGNYIFVGTLGAIVKDRTSGARMALTNFHVACVDSTWAVGNTMAQPGRNDGGTCPANKFGAIVRATLSDHVDGSVVSIDAGKATACSIVEIGNVKGKNTAAVGMAIRKRGRTSGLTYGKVTSVDQSVSINYGDGLGTHTLKNQIRIEVDTAHSTVMSDHGDSGSVVVDANNKVIGLLYAGIDPGHTVSFANPIQNVLDELNVDLCVATVSIVTKPVICSPLVTRVVVCVQTRPATCSLVTKPIICNIVTTPSVCVIRTRPATCPVVTKICPIVTRACPIGPGPIERRIQSGAGDAGGGDPGAWYGSDPVDDAFWEGYYAALDAVTEAEAEPED